MEKHPIESLMGVSMDNIKDMVDVNTVIGDPVQTQDGSTIIPISRVAFGFAAENTPSAARRRGLTVCRLRAGPAPGCRFIRWGFWSAAGTACAC